MHVALIGTRGVPARYGGFETAVEEIGAGLAERGHEVTIYCRGNSEVGDRYRGMRRVELPSVQGKALDTFTHSAVSTAHALRHRPDVALVFNAANSPFLAPLRARGIRTALHVDGHDGRRRKWAGAGRRYYSLATRLGMRLAHTVITDSQAMREELKDAYDVDPVFIPYGARTTVGHVGDVAARLQQVDLEPGGYHLVVARFEPENQVLEIMRAFVASDCEQPLVVVGFAGFPGDYNAAIEAIDDPRVRRLGAVWDQELLDALYAGAASYVHGHSVGGTNPSLLRAMVNGAPVVAFDCVYNRETTGGAALVFRRTSQLADLLAKCERDEGIVRAVAEDARTRALTAYRWDGVVTRYEDLLSP